MSHKHAHLMRSIFQDPPSANIHWREIESLLHHLGAEVEPSHGARFKITLNKVEAFLHQDRHQGDTRRIDPRRHHPVGLRDRPDLNSPLPQGVSTRPEIGCCPGQTYSSLASLSHTENRICA